MGIITRFKSGIASASGATGSVGLGITSALIAWFCFSLNDVGIKFLSGDYALHQIVLVRSSVGLFLTLAVIMPLEGGYGLIRTKHLGLHLLRGFCVVLANMLFFVGLASISLPEATSLFFVAPLFITALSVVFLGEKVGWYRWFAISVGLLGVVVMLRPGSDAFRLAALLPVSAAFAYACLQILTRKIGFSDRASTMSFYIQLVFILVCVPFGLLFGDGRFANPDNASIDFLFRAWTLPDFRDGLIMLGLGFGTALGGYLISQAYRVCEAVVIAPFEYIALILSIFWRVMIWNEWPDLVAWIGILLILGSGLLVFWREVVRQRLVAIRHPMPRNR